MTHELYKPGDSLQLTSDMFIEGYYDKEGDKYNEIKILKSSIINGILVKGKVQITSDLIIPLANISEIKYIRLNPATYAEEIQFSVNEINQNKKFSNMATLTINVNAYENLPPIIGDNEITIIFGSTKTFTVNDFTTNTTPAYSDPEGDGPFKLKILSLPGTGELRYDNIPCSINQEILFSNIALGLFTYIPDISDLNGYTNDDFDFSISDLGSQEFSV